jgi:hypothetical protein
MTDEGPQKPVGAFSPQGATTPPANQNNASAPIRRPPVRPPAIADLELITDLSVEVYKLRLEHSTGGGKGAVARMLEKDADDGKKLRGRAEAYNALTRAYLEVLSGHPILLFSLLTKGQEPIMMSDGRPWPLESL